jgi:hypothetical protein
MATAESEHERERLAKLYAGMSDAELQAVADDAGSLAEVALQELAQEIQRRRLDITLAESVVPLKQLQLRELVIIEEFLTVPEALFAKSVLDSAGIESFLFDDNSVRLQWLIYALRGVKLAVKSEDADVALQLLDQPTAGGLGNDDASDEGR